MSGAHEFNRKRQAPKMFVLTTDLKVQDQLDGTIRLQRGFLCQEQDKNRGDFSWVKVLDKDVMLKLEKKVLFEVSAELSRLLEPVSDPDLRIRLLKRPDRLLHLAELPLDTPLWVQLGKPDELAEAELRYVGPLTRGSNAVLFGVELKGSAVGKGRSNGTYKGHRVFSCPEGCALFLPVSHIRLRYWSRSSGPDAQEYVRENDHRRSHNHPINGHHNTNNNHPEQQQQQQQQQPTSRHISFRQRHTGSPPLPHSVSILPRTAEVAPVQNQAHHRASASPPPFDFGQRVCFALEDGVCRGEVQFCGPLPGRASSSTYVGVLLDTPLGNWDGFYKGEKLCHIPSPQYGQLVPVSKVSPDSKSNSPHHNVLHQFPKSILKPVPPPASKPSPTSPLLSAPKIALMPPSKQALQAPPLPPPKPTQKPLPPLPPPKPRSPTSPSLSEQLQQPTNDREDPPSPLRSPDECKAPEENDETGLEGELEVGSMVEVNDPPLFGVIQWIGSIGGISEQVAGIELDQEISAGTDGSYLGERHFRCPANKGLFVKLRNCRRDSRFPAPEMPLNQVERCNSVAFADWGSERVEEHSPPVDGEEARELYHGWKRGIQGHLNSCYLDATLFSLFSCCSSADWVLFWPIDRDTEQTSSHAQELLRCEIVNPLRRYGYVCASKTMALRRLLEAASSDTGFTNQEKDPEEFLNKLFQLLRVEPLLQIRSMTHQPQACHLYQLFPPPLPSSPTSPPPLSPAFSPIPLASPSAKMRVASVQALLESSFLHAGLKLVEAPSCLLLLMPRFGKDFKMFDAILPTLSLDITDLLDDTLRQCSICQAAALWECVQCYEDVDITPGHLKQYCQTCNTQVHSHRKRMSHRPLKIAGPVEPWTGSLHCARQTMSIFAVTCIETSHYVSFVKHGPLVTDWLFFDSMADREGGENGFNIPQVKACPEVGRYLSLSEEELSRLDASSLQEPARRLLCDSYMCLYHSPELSLYK
ncbi:ubiquitin carboxyl-terminal hydrolase CYLD isoform X2 [Nelusetta ayraudi]|uniref:ubiquitin carboxyl-terminal hydrolase CYLD isoform X2 n=1 Tax=Nelusetta ayraudi TaxID=303726 RepID=UPI003F7055D8